jgi:hypothetical protein
VPVADRCTSHEDLTDLRRPPVDRDARRAPIGDRREADVGCLRQRVEPRLVDDPRRTVTEPERQSDRRMQDARPGTPPHEPRHRVTTRADEQRLVGAERPAARCRPDEQRRARLVGVGVGARSRRIPPARRPSTARTRDPAARAACQARWGCRGARRGHSGQRPSGDSRHPRALGRSTREQPGRGVVEHRVQSPGGPHVARAGLLLDDDALVLAPRRGATRTHQPVDADARHEDHGEHRADERRAHRAMHRSAATVGVAVTSAATTRRDRNW